VDGLIEIVFWSALPEAGLKYHPLSAGEKTQHLTPRATKPGYEHAQTKILAATVARQIDVTHHYEDVGDKEIWRRGGMVASVVDGEVRGW
jgi:hypothetical protein